MKVLMGCIFTILVTNSVAVDVEKTVLQVENILKQNVQLPRLSREEILQLLNDIRAEDARSSSSNESGERYSKENIVHSSNNIELSKQTSANKLNVTTSSTENQEPNIEENFVLVDQEHSSLIEASTEFKSSTQAPERTLMVVLPYTPRDGSSLQELYTRPPRVEVVPVSKAASESNVKSNAANIHETLNNNAKLANKAQVNNYPDELSEFLNAHGLKPKPGQDHFLLPLEGFKPLPLQTSLDESVDLPENLLLTYDLISPEPGNNSKDDDQNPTDVLFEPLQPEPAFELDGSASETEKVVLPLGLPKKRITKATSVPPNYEPIDYDAVKVIPLKQGPIPVGNDENASVDSEFNKRQTENTTTEALEADKNNDTTTAPEVDSKLASPPAAPDFGASITDLEDSFGGAAPSQPGDSEIPPPKKNGFYWMLDWNSFLEVGDGDTKVNIRFEPKLGDPQMFLPVNVP